MIPVHRGSESTRPEVPTELRLVLEPETLELDESVFRPIDVSIVVPAYNEAARLPKLFRNLVESLDLANVEVIVVDDGSSDATARVAEEFVESIPNGQVIRLGTNSGKGRAIREGVMRTTGDVVVFMDADAATDLECFEPLVDSLADFDIAIGSRSHTDARVERAHRYRAYMGGVFNMMTRAIAGLPYRDTQCGFKAYRGGVARLLFSISVIDGFAFDVEVLRRAHGLGFSVKEVPVNWTHQAGSKIRHLSDPTKMLLDVTKVRLRTPKELLPSVRVPRENRSTISEALEPVPSPIFMSSRSGTVHVLIGHEPEHRQDAIRACLEARDIQFEEVICSVSTLSC